MLTRFLLGPSGTGKTFRCLAEIRAGLAAGAEGLPLILLAPKQATFQLERQLLSESGCDGYARLQILSFERLAEFILNEWGAGSPRLLSGQGRLMVMRALVERFRSGLRLFHATARMRGFAEQLSGALRELQRARLTPEALLELSERAGDDPRLGAKLHDLATLLRAYLAWMDSHALQDEDRLLDLASETVLSGSPRWNRGRGGGVQTDAAFPSRIGFIQRPGGIGMEPDEATGDVSDIRIGGLWLDGFAELAPQELELLAALLPFCQTATLALNIGRESLGQTSWLAPWSLVTQTYLRLRARVEGIPGIEVSVEWLDRDPVSQRFEKSPMLQQIERHWAAPQPLAVATGEETVRISVCPDRHAEVVTAAREIQSFVRSGGRYRDVAVIVRDLECYHVPVRRVFRAYGIPFFIDRREPAGHHPVAELTRSALRTIAFDWVHDDWFGVLKTGLAGAAEVDVDRLENEALARGWKGRDWHDTLALEDGEEELRAWIEPLRQQLMAPFVHLASALGSMPTGTAMARALKSFWKELGVGEQLEDWSSAVGCALHATVWELMQDWAENLELAFEHEALGLRGWLPIIETGLAALAVGVVPPALDQVLVGAVDRSRNPELRLAIVLGLNESVFPAAVAVAGLLTDNDRGLIRDLGVSLGHSGRDRLAREHYLGYIACTRSRERLVATCALRDDCEAALNPSVFMDRLRAFFPRSQSEESPGPISWESCIHATELVGQILPARLRQGAPASLSVQLREIDAVSGFLGRMREAGSIGEARGLSRSDAERLYGGSLRTSVSRLEEFASCPFRFFVSTGLRAQERERFEVDVREEGTFQHEVLARFHQRLHDGGKRWRDVSPEAARAIVAEIAEDLVSSHNRGLFGAEARSRFTVRSLSGALQTFIETMVRWMGQYHFDPSAVELGFGQQGDPLPPWKISLDSGRELLLRGKIDRVDLCTPEDGERRALCVVVDYKSSSKRLESVLMSNGLQLQLPAYLATLQALPEASALFHIAGLVPAGMFYVNLRGAWEGVETRLGLSGADGEDQCGAYRHAGRFSADVLKDLDSRAGADRGDQFNYSRTKKGVINAGCREVLSPGQLMALLASVEEQIRRMGREIFDGTVEVNPYAFGQTTACDRCQFRSICRMDPWSHAYRTIGSRPGA